MYSRWPTDPHRQIVENWFAPGLPFDVGRTASLGMVLDPTRGSFSYDPAGGKVVLHRPGQPDAVTLMRALNKRIASVNGNVVDSLWFSPDVNSSFTTHPLGAVIGEATDSYGRVVGHRGLDVVDGTAGPGSTGLANPSLTIAALAARNLEKIIAEGGRATPAYQPGYSAPLHLDDAGSRAPCGRGHVGMKRQRRDNGR